MRFAVGTGAALAVLFSPCAAVAGSAGAVLQVGATVVRPVVVGTVARSGGALRVRRAQGVNVTASAGAVTRDGGDILVRPPLRTAGASPLVVTIEY